MKKRTHIFQYLTPAITCRNLFTCISAYHLGRGARFCAQQDLVVERSEVGNAHMLVVETLGEIVHVVDEEMSAENAHRLTELKVVRSEVLLELVVGRLHINSRIGRLDVVSVLGHLLATDENGKRVAAIVRLVHLSHLERVVHQVVLNNEGSRLAVQLASVVPHGIEAQHFAVHFQELLELVEVGLCFERLQFAHFLAILDVRVLRHRLGRVDNDALALQPFLKTMHFRFDLSLILNI